MVKRQGYRGLLEQKVLGFIQENQLMPYQSCLLVAVSGGPDSACLLNILVELREELGIRLHVAHLNHQLRGNDSEADAQYVYNLAHRWGIPVTVERHDVKAYQAQRHISLEEAAREVRYTFLVRVAKSIGADRVAVGHTIDDNIETILMHLIRGAGIGGLRGLQPSGIWRFSGDVLIVVRPLLAVSRQETVDYCDSHQLNPQIDASNFSLPPLRNRIRHQLLPLLREYNPQIAEALLRTARIADGDLAFLNQETTRQRNGIVQKRGSTITLDKQRFLKLPSAIKQYLLRGVIEDLLGTLKDIEGRHIDEIMGALTKPPGKRLNLPGGLIFSIEYDKFLMGADQASLSPFPVLDTEFLLKIPGQTVLSGWVLEAVVINREQMTEKDDTFNAYFDYDKTGDKLLVRPRCPGDRFQPLGMSQPKKLSKFMIDAKIPSAWRQQVPIICSPQHILWVVGWRIDDRAKVSDVSGRILYLRFERG